MQQIQDAAEQQGGKILNALGIPMEAKGLKDSPFSSDYAALITTGGDWKTSKSLPAGESRWALAATNGAFHGWHIDCNGFSTYIEVHSGARLWILARSKKPFERWDDIGLFTSKFFTPDMLCDKLWDFEAILLTPGAEL